MFRENLGIRIVAILLALLIWLQSVLVSEQKTVVELPVNLRFVPQNITLENFPERIPFNVKGKGQDILKMMISKPKVNIDASNITPYTDILNLDDYSIDLPENVNVSFLGPAQSDQIAIQADIFHQKVVPVVLDFEDDLSRERIKGMQYSLEPDKITIFGPKSRIGDISNISTQKVGSKELDNSLSELTLDLKDGEISASQSTVNLMISGMQESTRVFSNIWLAPGFVPSRVAVKVQGESKLLSGISPKDIKVSISSQSDESGMNTVEVELPEGLKLIAVTPNKVRQRS